MTMFIRDQQFVLFRIRCTSFAEQHLHIPHSLSGYRTRFLRLPTPSANSVSVASSTTLTTPVADTQIARLGVILTVTMSDTSNFPDAMCGNMRS